MPKTLHVISHTHWDREWYLPFEKHRLRLVALLDLLLDLFDRGPAFRHFHLDGQMIPVEDYLAVRPDRAEAIRRAAQAGKLSLGPWYVLQDEFLTSGEANIRNLMYGLKLARRFGEPLLVGYLPDSFGNLSQMPQLLRGFGIGNAVFGRGLNRFDAAKAASGAEPGEVGYRSELSWQAPDGSQVLGVFMANWYSNAMDIPSEPGQAAEFLRRARDNSAQFATTDQLLLMNGCDHTPIKPDVAQVIEAVRDSLGDEIVHTDLASYITALEREVADLQVLEGELRSEYTDGWGTLADTLSSRLYQKQANWRCQQLLERWVEPLTAIASRLGREHPGDALWYAWATLMQNHPHDSICGCSCDEVHREMDVRFAKASQVGETLRDEAAQAIGDRVDSTFAGEGAATVLVFNPLPGERAGVVDVEVEFPDEAGEDGVEAFDAEGLPLSTVVIANRPGWNYKLPDNRFRVPYRCRRVHCRVAVPSVPGVGHQAIGLRRGAGCEPVPSEHHEGALENDFLRVHVHPGGLLEVEDKRLGAVFSELNVYEDGGDCGNEYTYRAPREDRVVTTAREHSWRVGGCFRSSLGGHATLLSELEVPARSNAEERESALTPLGIVTHLFLGRAARHLEVRVEIDNAARNHRLRALFPTDLVSDYCHADGQFDLVRRKIEPWHGWQNPSNPQPQQAFVDISDGERGLCVANRGLPSYEVLRDGRNTIALTLLRCVGELGDWGEFPTPDAQCLGRSVAEYALIPHSGTIADPEHCDAARLAYEYASPLWATQIRHFMHPHPERWANELPSRASFVGVTPSWLVLSALKRAETRDSLIVRVYNPFEVEAAARVGCLWGIESAHLVNLAEERQGELPVVDGAVEVSVPAKKIVTVELEV